MPSRDLLDAETVAELRRAGEHLGDPELVAQLAGLFRANAPLRLNEIRDAFAGRDAPRLERAAHTLKTNCAVFGAKSLAACCERLEGAAGRADFDAAAAMVAEAERDLPRVLAAVAALTARTAPGAPAGEGGA